MMIHSVREHARRRKLAGAAVLAFAVGGLVLSWVSAHATTLDPVTISAPAVEVVSACAALGPDSFGTCVMLAERSMR